MHSFIQTLFGLTCPKLYIFSRDSKIFKCIPNKKSDSTLEVSFINSASLAQIICRFSLARKQTCELFVASEAVIYWKLAV